VRAVCATEPKDMAVSVDWVGTTEKEEEEEERKVAVTHPM
jgi:hypothetical protein